MVGIAAKSKALRILKVLPASQRKVGLLYFQLSPPKACSNAM